MIVVINAGGSGSRLWPLSTPDYPKHLLSIGTENSLLQEAYLRAKKLTDHIYIVTEAGHASFVRDQLPELSEKAFIIEPARRGTAGCVLAGLCRIEAEHGAEEPVAFLNADHVIRDLEGFAYSFKLAAQAAGEHNKIALIGIEPTGPSTAFGYIEKDRKIDDKGLLYSVKGFEEKPHFELAQKYVRSGRYLWNGGYFVGSVNTFAAALKQFSPDWSNAFEKLRSTNGQEEFEAAYLKLKNDSLDYALMEPNTELLVVPASFDWLDVGSFSDVHTAVEQDAIGNHIDSEKIAIIDVENSLIINQEPKKQIGIIGLDNVVVINTKHGLLIARKDQDQKVKDIVQKLKD